MSYVYVSDQVIESPDQRLWSSELKPDKRI